MAQSRPVTPSQVWIMELMRYLGYQFNAGGVCFGISLTGAQAILLGERGVAEYNHRLSLLKNIYSIPDLLPLIEKAKQKRALLVSQAEAIALKEWLQENSQIMEQDKKFDIANLTPEQKQLFAQRVHQKISEVTNQLSEKERALLSMSLAMETFFDEVTLSQQGLQYYPHLFEKSASIASQDISRTLPLILSKALDAEHGVINADYFSGAYTKNDLIDYFKSLRAALEATPGIHFPIALILRSPNHAITVGYDSKKWVFIDANQLPATYLEEDEAIANAVLSAFSENNAAVFTTEILVTGDHNEQLKQPIAHLKNQPSWLNIHAITPEKAKLTDSTGGSWLQMAAKNGNIDILKKLLQEGAYPNQARNNGLTVLFSAVQEGQQEAVALLLENHVEVNYNNNPFGTTALIKAAQKGYIEIAKMLIDKGAMINLAQNDGLPPLSIAAVKGQTAMVKLLLEYGAYPNILDINGVNTMFLTAMEGHFDIVKILLEKIYPSLNVDRYVLLLCAAYENRFEEVQKLLRDLPKEDLALVGIDGLSPLFLAVIQGHDQIVELLLKQGSNPNQWRGDGVTPLHMAVEAKQLNIVKILLEKGANINFVDRHGQSPLFVAVINGHLELAEILLKNKAYPNQIDRSGLNALYLAAEKGDYPMVELLLNYGADPRFGYSPLNIAEQMGHHKIVDLIQKKLNALDKEAEVLLTDNNPFAFFGASSSFPIVEEIKKNSPKMDPEQNPSNHGKNLKS